jgi:hypothetical protein
VPPWLSQIFDQPDDRTPEDRLTGALAIALLTYHDATDRIIIRVRKDGDVAAFGIELPRARTFFADRSVTALARDGRRKRIFHSVSAHTRQLAGDRTVDVREHYRGLRTFDWKGYAVHIVLPSNGFVMKFDGASRYFEDVSETRRPHYVGNAETGAKIAAVLST